MEYEEWEGLYKKILVEFGFSQERDLEVAKILDGIIEYYFLEDLERKIRGKRVNVYGAGSSIERLRDFPEGTSIAADGTTSLLLERGMAPDIVVTDLDGKMEDLLEANEGGSIMVIHAHGDNQRAIERYAPRFKNVIGTTQAKPFGKLHNFGGFTDGDRAVFIAEHFGAGEIHLYGMDFHGKTGRYSLSEDSEIKRKKLLWAEDLINYLIKKGARVSYEG